MITQSRSQTSEKVFSKLADYGYSKDVSEKIWRWYHPKHKISDSK